LIRLLTLVLLALSWTSAARAEIIDRILAVVEGQLITLSDVRAVMRLGLEPAPQGDDPIALMLERLIERQLTLVEVNRYAPPEPQPQLVQERVQAIRSRMPDALAFETTLHQIGWESDDLERYIRDTLRIDTYLRQRFTATIQPTDDEVAAYYRLNTDAFGKEGVLRSYADVRSEARARLVAERGDALVRDWVAGLRRRANVVQLYYSTPSPPR
jgi:hypothetical protein